MDTHISTLEGEMKDFSILQRAYKLMSLLYEGVPFPADQIKQPKMVENFINTYLIHLSDNVDSHAVLLILVFLKDNKAILNDYHIMHRVFKGIA